MMKLFLVFLLATYVAAQELSEACQFVNDNLIIDDNVLLEECFNTYPVAKEVTDVIIKNLEIIGEIYPYVDIASNPPSKPEGYFRTMNFKDGLAELKEKFASNETNRTVASVYTELAKFISGFRDGHLYFYLEEAEEVEFDNILTDVYGMVPFYLDVSIDDNGKRLVQIVDPFSAFLPNETIEIIDSMAENNCYAETVDGKDAFEFFADFFGNYNEMKSVQGRLVYSYMMFEDWFSILQYPADGMFANHTIVFNDTEHTSVTFQLGYVNFRAFPFRHRDIVDEALAKRIREKQPKKERFMSMKQEKEIINTLKSFDFKKRDIYAQKDHKILPCGAQNGTNYIIISSFSYSGTDVLMYMAELAECVDLFSKNSLPVVIILPQNGGGSATLRALTQYLLMPANDIRVVRSMRSTERAKYVAADEWYMVGFLSPDRETCKPFEKPSEVEEFWKQSETDTFGNVTHKRTVKAFESLLSEIEFYGYYSMWRNVRKPTDIIVATDGYCFSACAFFVDNVIRSGAGIVAGYGITRPGDELFVAAQCPSGVIQLDEYFEDVMNNTAYGLHFASTITESYNVSNKLDETIPADYDILRIDDHMNYQTAFYSSDLEEFLLSALEVHEKFKTQCNPANKRLLLVTDECDINDTIIVSRGYACGSNGQWDKSKCKVASCMEGYVVDFENDKCIPNVCDPWLELSSSSTPPPAPSSTSPAPAPSSTSPSPAPSSTSPSPAPTPSPAPAPVVTPSSGSVMMPSIVGIFVAVVIALFSLI